MRVCERQQRSWNIVKWIIEKSKVYLHHDGTIFFTMKQQATIQHGLMFGKHAIDATANFVEPMLEDNMGVVSHMNLQMFCVHGIQAYNL